jgi:hypothetical protein
VHFVDVGRNPPVLITDSSIAQEIVGPTVDFTGLHVVIFLKFSAEFF